MDPFREIELKLEFDPADRPKLISADVLGQTEARARRLYSTYFDTPDHALLDAGYSLRVRKVGEQRIQTVKADQGTAAGLFARREWERPVAGKTPVLDEGSGPLIEELGAEITGQIAPVFATDVTRRSHVISRDGATVECAIDSGRIRSGGNAERLCEVELELQDGSARPLFDLARGLNEAVPVRIGVQSKSERGYALAAGERPGAYKAEPVALDAGGDAGVTFQTIANACIRQYRLNETALLATGGVEPLHQARVALRRLRTAFSLFRPLFADDERAALLQAELRWLARELGTVRNIDVLVPRFEGQARDRLVEARARAFDHVRQEVDSARTRLLMIDLAEWLALGAWRTHPVDPDAFHRAAPDLAADILDARRRRFKRRSKDLARLPDAGRHAARIEAKKLRYAAEFFASLYPGDKAGRRRAAMLEALEALQDHLGELNDRTIARRVLEELDIGFLPPAIGRKEQRRLLDRAEDAHEAVVDTRRFWRTGGKKRRAAKAVA